MVWLNSLDAVPAIRAYRDHAHAVGEAELKKARQRLSNGEDPRQVVELLVHNIINKLAHDPSVNLRAAVEQGQTFLLETVRTLFRVKDGD
jgi:glutamyl-tRNA reductase